MQKILLVLVLILATVSAVDVDCGYGDSLCRESELVDEFTDMEGYINEGVQGNAADIAELDIKLEDETEARGTADNRIIRYVDDQDQEIKDYSDVNDRRVVAYSDAQDAQLKASGQAADNELAQEISSVDTSAKKRDKWLVWLLHLGDNKNEKSTTDALQTAKDYADENDNVGGGISWKQLEGYVTKTLLPFLDDLFVTKSEFNDYKIRVQAQFNSCGCSATTGQIDNAEYTLRNAVCPEWSDDCVVVKPVN